MPRSEGFATEKGSQFTGRSSQFRVCRSERFRGTGTRWEHLTALEVTKDNKARRKQNVRPIQSNDEP